MPWKDQIMGAVGRLKEVAESETVQKFTASARETASDLASKARSGVLTAADAFVAANSDPTALKMRFFNADVTVLSPSDGLTISRPNAASLTIHDEAGNGVVIDVASNPPFVSKTIGKVNQLSGNTYDIGEEDGIDLLVLKG
ncbi:MAG: hypothetical protein HQL48_09985 [Gammaproteobacteria bacterium]|nr:hypothetical protein [Gammaproteobacteria bacterium]